MWRKKKKVGKAKTWIYGGITFINCVKTVSTKINVKNEVLFLNSKCFIRASCKVWINLFNYENLKEKGMEFFLQGISGSPQVKLQLKDSDEENILDLIHSEIAFKFDLSKNEGDSHGQLEKNDFPNSRRSAKLCNFWQTNVHTFGLSIHILVLKWVKCAKSFSMEVKYVWASVYKCLTRKRDSCNIWKSFFLLKNIWTFSKWTM